MKSKISQILNDIRNKREELLIEYEKLREKYGFKIEWRKIIWNNESLVNFRKNKKSIFDSIFSATVRDILSIPFIYAMIIPALVLDIFLYLYQQTAIRLYWIPLTKRADYIIFDRNQLEFLNSLQKINCMYCSYVNWLFQYAVEVAWRTEKYWCPIKNSRKKKWEHDWEQYFADYGDVENFKKTFCSLEDFEKLKNSKN